MAAAYKERIDRLDMLTKLISARASIEDCPDAGQLLVRMAEQYEQSPSGSARRRAMQRDLETLVSEGRIEIVNRGSKPLRYRRCTDSADTDPHIWDYTRQLMTSLIREALPKRRFERIWTKLREDGHEFGLGDDKLCILSDTQRLVPADIREAVLTAALEALASSRVLHAIYRDRDGKITRPALHPQALLQRGPRLYLFAMKNDEIEPVRMYALHRFINAKPGEAAARVCENFNLQEAVRRGQGDFAGGSQIALELLARGYVAELLRDCPLSEDQSIVDEPEGSAFVARVSAIVPDTGQLLRWLLGCGPNVEVLAPAKLREVVAAQAGKMAALYENQPAPSAVASANFTN